MKVAPFLFLSKNVFHILMSQEILKFNILKEIVHFKYCCTIFLLTDIKEFA